MITGRNKVVGILAIWLSGAGIAIADAVLDWNAIMLSTVATQNPFAQARFAAITQLAVFEALNSITGDYKPYLASITAPQGASADAAAIVAAHAVLKNYFPASAATLDAALLTSLAAIPDGPAKAAGVTVGEAAAAAMIAQRANDGSAAAEPYTPLSGPGYWQPTPPAFGPAILLHWRKVTPFGIAAPSQFRSGPPPALTSNRYRRDYDEVKEVGDVVSTSRPQDRSDVAQFFAATSAVQAWNSAAVQICLAKGYSLSENARILALLNMAINDSLIAVMETKYNYHFWRPVTAIRAGDTDNNPRTTAVAGFTPFIVTPAFPSYPSAHASASYAALEILERTVGNRRHPVTLSNAALPQVTLTYTKLRQIADDIDDARVYGGIHFRFDQEAGEKQGRRVGAYIHRHHLRGAKAKASCDDWNE